MDQFLGLLRIRILRGVNLAKRDLVSSDPYVIVKLDKQKLKTRVVRKNLNPEWNEELSLTIEEPILPVKLFVYDQDMFSLDDKMGDAEFEIVDFLKAVRTHLKHLPSGIVIAKVQPTRQNCLSEDSNIVWKDGKVVQDIVLRLRNVECGEVELQLEWIDIPGAKGL